MGCEGKHMITDNCWLPDLICLEDYGNDWSPYEQAIYQIFKTDFIDTSPIFEGKNVHIRKHPMEFGKEEAYFHVTCQDYTKNGERIPDLRRCERIKWIKAFIENTSCDSYSCDECSGIKIWSEPYKNASRVHIFLEEQRYMVVLEVRERYVLLVTAFYLQYDHALRKQVKHYNTYKATS